MNILDKNNDPTLKSGFKVPEGYFDQLPKKMIDNIALIEKEDPKIIKLNFKKYIFAIAASLIFLVATSIFIFQNKIHESSDFDIESYLMGWSDSEHYMLESFEEDSFDGFFIDLNIDANYLEDYLVNTTYYNEYLIDN